MSRLALFGLTACLAAVPAFAQTGDPPAAPAAAAPRAGADAAPTGNADKQAIKALRAGCRDEAKNQGLKGDARRASISACVVKARPELAGREQCRSDGRAKGLRGEGLHAFVKDCVKSKA